MRLEKVPKNVNEYIAHFPPNFQTLLKQIRATIQKNAPDALEMISYRMPAYKYLGMLCYFSAHKNHVSLHAYPSAVTAFKKELTVYKVGKGSIQFQLDQTLPLELIAAIVEFRVAENLEKSETKKRLKSKIR